MPPFGREFHVNIDAVLAGADRISSTFERLSSMIEVEMRVIVKQIIVDEFESAVNLANSDDGFPERYQQHLMETVKQIIPTVIMNGGELFVGVDLEEWLGGEEDLKKAFHQGAQLAEGGRLWGDYTGQALKNDDAEERHTFWEALRYGRDSVVIKGKNVHLRDSTWEETMEQYLKIWGEKAPQWLFIQFGQEEWEPTVPEIDIFNNIKRSVRGFAATFLAEILSQEAAIINTYKTTGLDVGFTGQKAPRVISGTAGKYRPGRFAPRAGIGDYNG